MATYNGERFLRKAIDSFLEQSFTDFTLFISDDGSKDRTPEICLEYAQKDKRVVFYRQEKNLGMFPNFKFTLDKADALYFMLASQDDFREKDFIQTCIENMEKRNIDVAMTGIADVDSYGRSMREMDISIFSGKPSVAQITRYVLQPEILGKCHFMYSLFKTSAMRKAWDIYPMRKEWGTDYHFSLAVVSHFDVYVDKRILFKKRPGGLTSPDALKGDSPDAVKRIIIKDPKNHMFPFGRFQQYFQGHMEALEGTPYRPLAALLLSLRLPRALYIHIRQRDIKKFIKKFFHIS